jgi:F-type H+-transporting ATPase subunit gamma
MAQTQSIKRRIKSVKNTKQITKAMELVAAAKMRKAQEATLRSRAYRNSAREILARLNQLTEASSFSFFAKRKVKTRLYIVFTSDRGLAGAYNSNVLKQFIANLNDDLQASIKSKVIVVGKKGISSISKLKDIDLIGVYQDWPTYPTATDISPILRSALDEYISKNCDEVIVLYTDFISTISQKVKRVLLLPAIYDDVLSGDQYPIGKSINNSIFEPSPAEVMEKIVPKLIESQLYQATLESIASEQSMRMVAMKSATDNAKDLIDDLTLEYNSARQAGITQELAEITGGADAIS